MHEKQNMVLDDKSYNIGIITDVHGNDKALIEALKLLKDCDFIISLGDLIGIGPNSNEVLDIVAKLNNFYTVLGNHERYLLYGFHNPSSCLTDEHQMFTQNSISKENIEYVKRIPIEICLSWNKKTFCFLHYSRKVEDDIRFTTILHFPTYEKLVDQFKYHKQDVIVYGHEHVASEFYGKRIFINPGSSGCPCPTKGMMRCGILHLNKDDSSITYEHLDKIIDQSSVVKSMIEKDMPNRELVISDFYREDE